MADLQIVMKYRPMLASVGATVMWLTFPLWGAAAPIYAVCVAFAAIFSPIQMLPFLAYLPLAVLIFFVGLKSLICFWDDQLTVNREGICFPPIFVLTGVGRRRQRSWDDVARIAFVETCLPSEDGTLAIYFRSGGVAMLDLRQFPTNVKEQLLLAFEVWAPNAEKDPEINLLQNKLHDGTQVAGSLSYTKMWEDEMNRRYSSTAFVPLPVGSELRRGKLRIVKQLAFGGLSAIYLAQLKGTETVVLKESVIADDTADDLRQKAAELFAREAELLSKLNHPNIAKVRDHFSENGRTYVMLDYISGCDLRQLVKHSGPRQEQEALRWTLDVARILQYLHDQSPPVLHRDLTPDNIVLSDKHELFVIDFGAANEFIGTATGTLVGKQSYISPEQFRGNATTSSDIYALGCTLFFLLTGVDPEPLDSSSPREHNPNISEETDDIVRTCTEFDPEDRVPTVDELIQRIESIVARSGYAVARRES